MYVLYVPRLCSWCYLVASDTGWYTTCRYSTAPFACIRTYVSRNNATLRNHQAGVESRWPLTMLTIESIERLSIVRGRRGRTLGCKARPEQQQPKCTHLEALDLFNSRSRMVGTSISAPSFSNDMADAPAAALLLMFVLLLLGSNAVPSPLSLVLPYTAKRRVVISRTPTIVEC